MSLASRISKNVIPRVREKLGKVEISAQSGPKDNHPSVWLPEEELQSQFVSD